MNSLEKMFLMGVIFSVAGMVSVDDYQCFFVPFALAFALFFIFSGDN